ncbi:MAG: 8-oxo-(d)GTP phosphatase [Nocardioidaceae bacterium]|nr:8-oxo-(d)GTP phosphatase [Nocardioidaceae bacterium]
MASERITKAAGGIVWRKAQTGVEVLLIHRPSYDDWTFPKGKADPGESLQATAVREIAEETGFRVRLGHPLGELSYPVGAATKSVTYWCARLIGDEGTFEANDEVDEIRWVGLKGAEALLTYEHDETLLDTFRGLLERKAHRTRTTVVLRHGKATPRDEATDDLERPLTEVGRDQAEQLVPLLGAYGIRLVVSSPAVRCAQTVEPFAQSISTFLEIDDRLGEDASASQVQRSVEALLERKSPVVMCTHRPTLPWVFDSVGTRTHDLAPGEGVVLHHRRGELFATELLA